jgi:hypothetical protein
MKNDPAAGRSSRVDTAAGVIRGVKIISRESTNGRRYDCLREAARLYEGVSVRVNHQHDADDSDRDADDILGELRNVRTRPDGLYGDLHYLKSHPMARRLAEAAERMPSAFGLSHNVSDWDGHYEGGTYVVTAIREVESVDLVADPATTKGLFESRTKPRAKAGTRRKGAKPMRLTEWAKKQKPRVRAAVRRLIEDGAADGSMLLDGGSPEQSIKQAFRAAVMAVVDDDAGDMAGAMGKIKAILKARDDLMASGAIAPAADADAPTEAAPLDDETDAAADDLTAVDGMAGDLADDEDDGLEEEHDEPDGDEEGDDLDGLADDLLAEGDMDMEDEDDEDLDALEEGSDLEDEDDEKKPMESRRTPRPDPSLARLKEENRRLKAERHVRSLCEQARVARPSRALLKALAALDDDAERRQLLRESRRSSAAVPADRVPLAEALTSFDDEEDS